MGKNLYILFLSIAVICCNSMNQRKNDLNIELLFYPSGVIEDLRYSIIVTHDSIKVKNHYSSFDNGTDFYYAELNQKEKLKINDLIIDLKTIEVIKDPSISDTWGAKLVVNGVEIYVDDDFSVESMPSEIAPIINYLISLSKVHIEFYGFS